MNIISSGVEEEINPFVTWPFLLSSSTITTLKSGGLTDIWSILSSVDEQASVIPKQKQLMQSSLKEKFSMKLWVFLVSRYFA